MRLTQALLKHHKGRLFKLKWLMVRNKKVPESLEFKKAVRLGLPLEDGRDLVEDIRKTEVYDDEEFVPKIIGPVEEEAPLDNQHPLFKEQPCYSIGDSNVLLKGLEQAKVLLNTVQIGEGLPGDLENLVGTFSIPNQDTLFQRTILYSHVFDAMQEKLPKKKDPNKPAWIFKRDYGIIATRKFQLLTTQLLHLCNAGLGPKAVKSRSIINDAYCVARFQKGGIPVQIQNRADVLVTSHEPLPALTSADSGNSIPHLDLYPMKCTVSMALEHFYHDASIYPLSKVAPNSHPHMALIHYDPEEVQNIYEQPVTESQYFSRTLVKAFTIAACRAQQLYGQKVKKLPVPMTVQIVQTDGRQYHFAAFQLNSLNLNAEGEKNIFWMLPQKLNLFGECAYINGRPTLTDYNPEVLQRLLAFYAKGL